MHLGIVKGGNYLVSLVASITDVSYKPPLTLSGASAGTARENLRG